MDIRKFPKKKSSLRPQVPVLLNADDNELMFIKAMGIDNLSLVLRREELKGDLFHRGMERFRKNGFTVTDAACMELQKNKAIHLGLETRDREIEAFIDSIKLFSSEGIEFTSLAWQPHGILRTDKRVGEHTRGQRALYCDACEILSRQIREEREYGEEEIWGNFSYFAKAVIPELERAAGMGSFSAAEMLGDIYSNGLYGIAEDDQRAYEWYLKASHLYSSSAYEKLFSMVKDGYPCAGSDSADMFALLGARLGSSRLAREVVIAYSKGRLECYRKEIEQYYVPVFDEDDGRL